MPQTEGHNISPGISWNVITHVHKERTNDWYWALGLVSVVGAGISLWVGDLLFAIIILVGAASLEGFLGYCVGCAVFAQLMKTGIIPESVCVECSNLSARFEKLSQEAKPSLS